MSTTVRRRVATVTVVAGVLSLGSSILGDVERYVDGAFLPTAADRVAIGAGRADLFRWSLIADMLGSYLLLVPAALFLWHARRADDPIARSVTLTAALAYATLGAAGAALWAGAGAPLIERYDTASGAEAEMIATTFAAVANGVGGVWQMCVGLGAGVWWIGTGLALRRAVPRFAVFSMVAGALALLAALTRIVGVEFESNGPSFFVFLPIVIWAIWLGVHIWRGTDLSV